jgi:phosphoglycolate phosphatase
MKKCINEISVVIFDFDGVLIDSSKDIANAANYTLRTFGFDPIPYDIIVNFIGGGAEPLVRKCLEYYAADTYFDTAIKLFKRYYSQHFMDETRLYPRAKEVLKECYSKGLKIGLATNKVENITVKLLEKLDIIQYFEIIVGPTMVEHRKPHPEAIKKILYHFSLPACKAVIIGDKQEDIFAGKAAGTLTCGVTYGFGKLEEILNAKPDFIINRIDELLELLNKK